MKFSFLIPSKNRLHLLKHAVNSIRSQQGAEIEIAISDNCSDEDYAGYIRELNDPRIVYQRAPQPVSITENWDRALQLASGDYVLMLGDDDALVPGFAERMSALIKQHNEPDLVYLAAYHYGYPGVIASMPSGYLASVQNSVFFEGHTEPYFLPTKEIRRLGKEAGNFRHLFGFNSQHFLFRAGYLRNLFSAGRIWPLAKLDQLAGSVARLRARRARPAAKPWKPSKYLAARSVFQSPYPDYFAAAASFMTARSVMIVPEPMVIIGISPKSFGYYFFNNQLESGFQFLDIEDLSPESRKRMKDVLLPGDKHISLSLVTMAEVRRKLPRRYRFKLNFARYRVLQIAAFLRSVYVTKARSREDFGPFVKKLSTPELLAFHALDMLLGDASLRGGDAVALAFNSLDAHLQAHYTGKIAMLDIGPHTNIGDAVAWLGKNRPAARV